MRWEGGKAEVMTQGKYEIIHNAIKKDNNLLSISRLCEIAGVSRSGYYAWEDAAPIREKREESDRTDFGMILKAYKFRGYAKGARGIFMRLLHMGQRKAKSVPADGKSNQDQFCVSECC